MKKLSLFACLLFACSVLFSSCGRKGCGGGWYGNKNFGYQTVPVEKSETNNALVSHSIVVEEQESCK